MNDTEVNEKKEKNKIMKNFINLIIKIIVLVLVGYIIFGVVFGIKRMNNSFMSPYIAEGDLLLFYRLDNKYELDDVVIVDTNKKEYVLRIVAKEGQTVDINNDGELLIDGLPSEHIAFYKTEKDEESSEITFPYKVEKGKLFVMNDYRLKVDDSRIFGAVSSDLIKGKIFARIQIRNI